MPSDGRRLIDLDGVPHTWRLGVHEEGHDLRLTLIVEPPGVSGQRLTVVFQGQAVRFLFGGAAQSLVVRPSVVRRAVEEARARGWPEREARMTLEPFGPDAFGAWAPLDVAEAELRAACEQWFVPYPGRAALSSAWDEVGGDAAALGARFPAARPAQLDAWLFRLRVGRYEVDGLPVRSPQLGVRSMNFGQEWRTPGLTEVDVRLVLPSGAVRDLLARDLTEHVADSRASFDETSEIDRALEAAGWPGPEAIFADPTLASLFVGRYAHDIVLGWLGDGEPAEQPGFVLNSASATISGARVEVRGRARHAGLAVAYQDV